MGRRQEKKEKCNSLGFIIFNINTLYIFVWKKEKDILVQNPKPQIREVNWFCISTKNKQVNK